MFPVNLVSQVSSPVAVVSSAAIGVSLPKIPQVHSAQGSKHSSGSKSDNRSKGEPNTGPEFADVLTRALQQTDVKYSVDLATGIVSFQMIDPETQELIRQIPSEEAIAMAERIRVITDKALGLIIDKEA